MKNLLIIVAVFMFGANTLNVRTNTRIMTSNPIGHDFKHYSPP